MLSTSYARNSQAEDAVPLDTVNILEIADPICSVAEWCAFERRLDKRLTFSDLLAHVCLDYELGCVDAKTSMQRLHEHNLLLNADHFMTIVAAGVRSLAAISSAQLKSAAQRSDEVSAASQVVGLTHKIEGG